MIKLEGIKARKQLTGYTCGPASLRSIFYFYGLSVSEQELVDIGEIEEDGTDFKTMRRLAHHFKFSFYSRYNANLEEAKKWLMRGIPVLVCYQDHGKPNGKNGHYAVLTGIKNTQVVISDPSNYWEGDGKKFANDKNMIIENFLKRWFEMENGIRIKRWFAIIKPKIKKKK